MLHPRYNLELIVMEGVSSNDINLGDGPEEFHAVDLSEYHGGEDSQSAEHVVITQVKYSPSSPDKAWTLSRLCSNTTRRARSSVLGKLARAFEALLKESGGQSAKITLQIHTNQPLDTNLSEQLDQIRHLIADKTPRQASAILRDQDGVLGDMLKTLKDATSLSWTRLTLFVQCWNVDTFGQSLLADQKGELFNELISVRNMFADLYMDRLCQFVQERGTAHRSHEIRPHHVYAQLRTSKDDFLPAPFRPEPIQHLQETIDLQQLNTLVENTESGFILLHGAGGTGKSVTLQRFAQTYQDGDAVVVYDCWAKGKGIRSGSERYWIKGFLTQVTNELENLYECEIFAEREDSYHSLSRRFTRSLETCASIASRRGHRLVIAVDAADNAITAFHSANIKEDSCFIPWLWNFTLPANCVVIVSTRSERRQVLEIPDDSDVQELQASGFQQKETANYVRAHLGSVEDELVKFIHHRTGGVPRLLQTVLERTQRSKPTEMRSYVDQIARGSLEEYYQVACTDVANSFPNTRELLGILLEIRSTRMDVLADITGDSLDYLQQFAHALYFGLSITDEDKISFRNNEDFYNFVVEYTEPIRTQIQEKVAQYCITAYQTSSYAQDNFAFHLFQAELFDELVEWQISEEMDRRIQALAPDQEDALEEIRLGIKAAIALGRFDAALVLLTKAANIAHGRDVFSQVAEQHIETSVEFSYHYRLLEYINKTGFVTELPGSYFEIALSLARLGRELDLAEELRERGLAIKSQEQSRTERNSWLFKEIKNLGLYESYTVGLAHALEWLQRIWKPQETLLSVYAQLTNEWAHYRPDSTWPEIDEAQLEDPQLTCAIAGMLSNTINIPKSDLEAAIVQLTSLLDTVTIPSEVLDDFMPNIVTNLLCEDLGRDLALKLIELWNPTAPRSPVQRWFPGDELHEFLRKQALNVELGRASFDPETYAPPPLPNESLRAKRVQNTEAYELGELRKQLHRHYPAAQAVAKALLGAPASEVLDCVEKGLNRWKEYKNGFWYKVDQTAISFGQECLLALTLLDGIHSNLAQEICELVEGALDSKWGNKDLADVLIADRRYHGLAERLIQERMDDISNAQVPAETKVETMLELCPALQSIEDFDQARDIFQKARIEANTIDGRARTRVRALTNALSRASDTGVEVSDIETRHLVSLFDHISEVSDSENAPDFSNILRIIARQHPDLALVSARSGEAKNHVNLGRAAVAVGQGMLDRNLMEPENIWPLVHFSDLVNESLFKQVGDQLISNRANLNLDRPLQEWAQRIRQSARYDTQLKQTQEFLTWADERHLSSHEIVETMRQRLVCLEPIQSSPERLSSREERNPPTLLDELRAEIALDPNKAFDHLTTLESQDLKDLPFSGVRSLVEELLPHLVSRDIARLSEVISAQDWKYLSEDALSLLVQLADHVRASPTAFGNVKNNIQTFISSSLPHLLSIYVYEDRGLASLIECSSLDTDYLLEALLNAATKHLSSLDANQIYLLISHIVKRLPGAMARNVFALLLEQACQAANVHPIPIARLVGESTEEKIAYFLCDLLGDPRQEVNWRAAYSLVDYALSSPQSVLPVLFDCAESETYERWMTVREWLLFIIHHISLRDPSLLVPYVDELQAHALNPDFPHASIREYAKRALLKIEEQLPGRLSDTTIAELSMINEPFEYLDSGTKPRGTPYEGVQWSHRSLDDEPFNFDPIDTMPYWFSPLAGCFGLHRCHVADAAKKWVVDKWRITDEQCREEYRELVHRFGERNFSYRHREGLPSIVSLRNYVEYHSLCLVAGEFIDTKPAYGSDPDSWRAWEDWARYQLYPADPALTTRLLTGIPVTTDNFGEFEEDFDTWAARSNEADFETALYPESNSENWMIIAADQNARRNDRNFSIDIDSALVHPDTACALARAIESEQQTGVFLPRFELPYDGLFSRLHTYDEHDATVEWPNEQNIRDEDDLFYLEPAQIHWSSDRSRHAHDPKWPSTGRSFLIPTRDFCSLLNLTQKPLCLDYVDPSGQIATRSEIWHSYTGTDRDRADYNEGQRLLVRKDLLQHYLKLKRRWLILKIRLRRERPYNFPGRQADEFDHGVVRVYIFNEEGKLFGC